MPTMIFHKHKWWSHQIALKINYAAKEISIEEWFKNTWFLSRTFVQTITDVLPSFLFSKSAHPWATYVASVGIHITRVRWTMWWNRNLTCAHYLDEKKRHYLIISLTEVRFPNGRALKCSFHVRNPSFFGSRGEIF